MSLQQLPQHSDSSFEPAAGHGNSGGPRPSNCNLSDGALVCAKKVRNDEFNRHLEVIRQLSVEKTSTMQTVGKKEIYDSFSMKIGGKVVDNWNSCVSLRHMVQKAIGKKQKGVEFFLKTENEPPQTIQDARGRTVNWAGTVIIQGKTISYYIYAIRRGHASRAKREDAGSGADIDSDVDQSNTDAAVNVSVRLPDSDESSVGSSTQANTMIAASQLFQPEPEIIGVTFVN